MSAIVKQEYKYSEITAKILNSAFEVHSILGNGFQEVEILEKNLLTTIVPNNIKYEIQSVEDIQKSIADVEEASAGNTGLNFTIAINYGSRDEMIRAMKKMLADGHINPDEMSEALFEHYLDTAGMPDPDLVIRTSGEQRVSNFLLWQMAYSEFYFTPVLWPDYNKETMIEAIRAYSKRDRRFGGV